MVPGLIEFGFNASCGAVGNLGKVLSKAMAGFGFHFRQMPLDAV